VMRGESPYALHNLSGVEQLFNKTPDSVPLLPLGKDSFCIFPREYNALGIAMHRLALQGRDLGMMWQHRGAGMGHTGPRGTTYLLNASGEYL
jgi:hypothetical protein